jgi:hypothetical protein
MVRALQKQAKGVIAPCKYPRGFRLRQLAGAEPPMGAVAS